MTIRKKACKAFARNLVASLIERQETVWQQDYFVISDEEIDEINKELTKIWSRVCKTIDFDELGKIKPIEGESLHERMRK